LLELRLRQIAGGLHFRVIARAQDAKRRALDTRPPHDVTQIRDHARSEAAVRHFERRAPVTRVAGERMRFP